MAANSYICKICYSPRIYIQKESFDVFSYKFFRYKITVQSVSTSIFHFFMCI